MLFCLTESHLKSTGELRMRMSRKVRFRENFKRWDKNLKKKTLLKIAEKFILHNNNVKKLLKNW